MCSNTIRNYENIETEASCGQCMFAMKGHGCDLAIKIENKYYYVKGANIDDFGDAHADDGFCKAIKKVVISGKLIDDNIRITSFKTVP